MEYKPSRGSNSGHPKHNGAAAIGADCMWYIINVKCFNEKKVCKYGLV